MDVTIIPQNEISRGDILDFERALAEIPGAIIGDSEICPLKHSFAPGIYVREIFIPKGTMIVGKIHKHAHPNFLLSGKVIILTEHGGREELTAPLSMISPSGTKRVVFAVEDCRWVTVHENKDNETNLEKLEDFVIAKSFEEYEAFRLEAEKPKEISCHL